MRNSLKTVSLIIAMMILLIGLLVLQGCTKVTSVEIAIGFKQTGGAGEYNESLSEFEIGTRMFVAAYVQIITNSNQNKNYTVEIIIPRSNDIITDPQGGLMQDKLESITGGYKLTYTVWGSKNANKEKMLFSAIPYQETSAVFEVYIYDSDGDLLKGYSHEIFFKY